jgi:N-methylhydantoinase A
MRVALDTGGTFTDCVFLRNGAIEILKIPSTPQNPAEAIRVALGEIGAGREASHSTNHARGRPAGHPTNGEILEVLCGTTVGTNALLERRGGRVALVTTAGFEDVLEIGRQARSKLYELSGSRPAPLIPRKNRFGLRERIGADGSVLRRPSKREIANIVRRVRESRADAAAVCLLFSFLRPEHERLLARSLRAAGLPVSVSHEILPEFREFERTAATVVNAYLVPVMSGYLDEIERHAANISRADAKNARGKSFRAARVRVMQSSGGILSAKVAAREPVRTILSGPAGGVLGARQVAIRAGHSRAISLDMGGTSTDVSLIEGALRTTNETIVAELPVSVPMLDIHTVGAGGGSLGRFDRGGALRVGPESAGADPGPICYGRGELPTITDANLILGRLGGEGLLGGEFRLDRGRAVRYMERAIRGVRGMRTVEQFAQGMVDVVEATMGRAIRVISVERGRDPRDYVLVAFGGAGGLHACNLAESLAMRRVTIPKFPGALSALGILCADAVKDFSQTVLLGVDSASAGGTTREGAGKVEPALRRAFLLLEKEGMRVMRAEGFSASEVRVERSLDMRYSGQAYELSVPARAGFVRAFHREHAQRYGYSDTARPVEVVNVRARFVAASTAVHWPRQRDGKADCGAAAIETREVLFGGERHSVRVYSREKFRAGNRFRGPAIVAEYSGTTVVPPGWRGRVDGYGNLQLVSGG